jgi:mycothiol synthase
MSQRANQGVGARERATNQLGKTMPTTHPEKPQLRMVWTSASRHHCPPFSPAAGYSVRTFRDGDEQAFLSLMSCLDFDPWDEAKLAYNMNRIIPEGWFLATDSSRQIIATAMCMHNYSGRSPFTGDVGWVACHPDHRGKGLGRCLCARVTRRFLKAGYTAIQLHTEYYRLPAIKTYLNLGYVPSIASPEASALWECVCAHLNWPFTWEAWNAQA